MTLNIHEAPMGCIARKGNCAFCCFDGCTYLCSAAPPCMGGPIDDFGCGRQDNCSVYFSQWLVNPLTGDKVPLDQLIELRDQHEDEDYVDHAAEIHAEMVERTDPKYWNNTHDLR